MYAVKINNRNTGECIEILLSKEWGSLEETLIEARRQAAQMIQKTQIKLDLEEPGVKNDR